MKPNVKENPKFSERRNHILEAAYGVFGQYGFRRTSMDDIAKAAGISRPSLYQHFANKNDIFSALVDRALATSIAEAEQSLREPKPLPKQLADLFEIMFVSHHRALESLPHGDEILGMKSDFVTDLFMKWDEEKRQLFERALSGEPQFKNGLASSLAQMISLSISGMKSRNLSVVDIEKEVASLIDVTLAARSGG